MKKKLTLTFVMIEENDSTLSVWLFEIRKRKIRGRKKKKSKEKKKWRWRGVIRWSFSFIGIRGRRAGNKWGKWGGMEEIHTGTQLRKWVWFLFMRDMKIPDKEKTLKPP
jgi:hypothetical protein